MPKELDEITGGRPESIVFLESAMANMGAQFHTVHTHQDDIHPEHPRYYSKDACAGGCIVDVVEEYEEEERVSDWENQQDGDVTTIMIHTHDKDASQTCHGVPVKFANKPKS